MAQKKKLAGSADFDGLMRGLIAVPKWELDAELDKYDRRRASKRVAAAKKRPKRRRP